MARIGADTRTRHVSLSHSSRAYGAAISSRPVGLDVQTFRSLDQRAWKFFLNDSEIMHLRESGHQHAGLLYWVAKEASFKCDASAEVYKDVRMSPVSTRSDAAELSFESPSGDGRIRLMIIGEERLIVGVADGGWS